MLLFDGDGNFVEEGSGIDTNLRPMTLTRPSPSKRKTKEGKCRCLITRAGDAPAAPVARRIPISAQRGLSTPNIFGYEPPVAISHSNARNAISVAAWAYDGGIAFTAIPGFR